MRTPGHAVLNSFLLTPGADAAAVLLGAVLPDLPIAVLYLWERFVRDTPEERIWSEAYQRPLWQALIHGAHSIPLALAGTACGVVFQQPRVRAFFHSVLLHALADFPLHADDAHRHFVPFSSFAWKSPISYWDVRHHGRIVAAIEALLVAELSAALWQRVLPRARAALVAVLAFYAHGYLRTFLEHGGRWQPYF